MGGTLLPPISPLAGEMAGRPEGGRTDRRARRLAKALALKADAIMTEAAGGMRKIEERRGLAAFRAEADAVEAGFVRQEPAPIRHGFPSWRAARDWRFTARDAQRPPAGDWRVWLLMGGRGSGKTRAGAEWVHALALAKPEIRIALVAETLGDAREVMIDGVSGICRIARRGRPDFEASRRRLVWPNGSIGQIFSSEDPESLRGPQFHLAWADELGKWKHAQETWDMLQFGLRLGEDPRVLVTTTPRPVPLLRALAADPATAVRHIRTTDNARHLSPGFLAAVAARYGGTRLGRQELDGELIADREDALWNRARLEALRSRRPGPLSRIVVAVDPPATASAASVCGIVVAGLDGEGRAVVLADCSVTGASPAGWAGAVVRAFRRFDADRVVAEVNQGGDMIAAMLRSVDAHLPVTTVRATRGKFLRAEPVAALYEQGRVAHAAAFPELEDQMCDLEKAIKRAENYLIKLIACRISVPARSSRVPTSLFLMRSSSLDDGPAGRRTVHPRLRPSPCLLRCWHRSP